MRDAGSGHAANFGVLASAGAAARWDDCSVAMELIFAFNSAMVILLEFLSGEPIAAGNSAFPLKPGDGIHGRPETAHFCQFTDIARRN
jgi:hypothetical protein